MTISAEVFKIRRRLMRLTPAEVLSRRIRAAAAAKALEERESENAREK